MEAVVEGVNDEGQISVKQIGDDAKLTCKAILTDTGAEVNDVIRYGWEWRYLDNDPVTTSNVAVGIKTEGESMELRGVRAPEGMGGRGVKGRCVLYVPAKVIDPSETDEGKEMKYASKYFTVVVDRLPLTRHQPPIPGHELG